jgi:hypothetical protein
MGELPDAVSAEVERLFAEGESFADEQQDEQALARFQASWDLLPEPKTDWEPALRILVAIADSYFYLGHWQGCFKTLQRAVKGCGGALENPFVRLRMGQSLFELGDLREAANWMVFAYLLEGTQLFEDQDPKYLAFLKGQLEPPPGGWPEGW